MKTNVGQPKLKPRTISGFADYTEAENAELARWIKLIEETYRLYGFSRLTPRPLELRDVLLSRGGIQKQVYGVSRLPDEKATDLALPFDRTVPMAHWVALNANDLVFPYKRYDISYSYRGERAQAGRFRGFFQADIDIIGQDKLDPTADAECIAVLFKALDQLGIGSFKITLNHIGMAKAILDEFGFCVDRRPALVAIDKLVKIGVEATAAELVETTLLDQCQAEQLTKVFSFDGDFLAFRKSLPVESPVIDEAVGELESVWTALIALGVPQEILKFQPGIVRGLDYYTGTVFETFLVGKESIGSVASGGRYEDLVSTFSSLSLPGVGGSIGLTRLFYAACKEGLVDFDYRSEADVFVGFRKGELRETAQIVARKIRDLAVNTDLYSGSSSFKKQLVYADKKGIPLAIFVMDKGSIVVKDMKGKTQSDHNTIDEAVSSAIQISRIDPD